MRRQIRRLTRTAPGISGRKWQDDVCGPRHRAKKIGSPNKKTPGGIMLSAITKHFHTARRAAMLALVAAGIVAGGGARRDGAGILRQEPADQPLYRAWPGER